MHMKLIHFLALAVMMPVCLVSCSQTLSPTPPPSVTNAGALQTYRNAIGGDTAALMKIGEYYLMGTSGFPKDERMAANAFETAAKLGHTQAQAMIALFYESGRGRLQSNSKALDYYRRASASGSRDAEQGVMRVEARIRAEEEARRARVINDWNKAMQLNPFAQ